MTIEQKIIILIGAVILIAFLIATGYYLMKSPVKRKSSSKESWSDFKQQKVKIALLVLENQVSRRNSVTLSEEVRKHLFESIRASLSSIGAEITVEAPSMNVPRFKLPFDCPVIGVVEVVGEDRYIIKYFKITKSGLRKKMIDVEDKGKFVLSDRSVIIRTEDKFRQKFPGFMSACFKATTKR